MKGVDQHQELWAQDVRITVFKLKDGKEVEALRFAAGQAGGMDVYKVTRLDGTSATLFSADVVGRSERMVSADQLPATGRKLLDADRTAEAARSSRRVEEEAAEREDRELPAVESAPKPSDRRNPCATAGMWLGIASVPFFWIGILPILAVVFSAIGAFKASSLEGAGGGKATAGLLLGIVFTLMYLRFYGHI